MNVLDLEFLCLTETTDVGGFEPIFEAAAELGVGYVATICQVDDDEVCVERFCDLCAAAEPYRLRPALEFTMLSTVKTVKQAVQLASATTTGAVLVDPLHLRRSGGGPEDLAACVAAHPELFPYAQLCDALSIAPTGGQSALADEARNGRLLPGDGELPLRRLLAALPAEIPLSVETPVRALSALPAVDRARAAYVATAKFLSPWRPG